MKSVIAFPTGGSLLRISCLAVILLWNVRGDPASACSGNTMGGYAGSPYIFSTYNSLETGGTAVNYLSAQFRVKAICPNWKLTVKATGNFVNGSHSFDLAYVSVQFNTVVDGPSGSQIGIPSNPFRLALTEVPIIPRSNEPLHPNRYPYFEIRYDMIIQGGNQLISLYNGVYSTNVVFTLYDGQSNVVSTSSPTRVSFQVQYGASYSSSLLLTNGADNITLRFNNANDIKNGVTIVKAQGMQVTCYDAHQILVKAAGSRLNESGTLNSIPVSTIRLSLRAPSSANRIVCYSLPLSASSRVFADNPMTDYNYQVVLYDLTYTIAGNDPNIVATPMGTYTTSLVFVIVPK